MYKVGDLLIGKCSDTGRVYIGVANPPMLKTSEGLRIDDYYFTQRELDIVTPLTMYLLTGDILRQELPENDSYV